MEIPRPTRARLTDALACVARHDYADARSAAVSAVDAYVRKGDASVIEYMLGELSLEPAEAWELLATRELIPVAWVDDPRRRFDSGVTVLAARIRQRLDRFRGEVTTDRLMDEMRAVARMEARRAYEHGEVDRTPEVRVAQVAPGRIEVELWPPDAGPPLTLAHPRALADCLLLAADAANVPTAEAIARAVTGRDVVVWRVVSFAARRQPVVATGGVTIGYTRPLDEVACADLAALGYALLATPDDTATLLCPALGE